MTGSMNKDQALRFFDDLANRFDEAKGYLNALDAAIGDGDHGTTIARGMSAAADSLRASDPDGAAQVFAIGGDAFQKASGGAGGLLFAQLFKCIGQAGDGVDLTVADIGTGMTKAVEQISRFGRSQPGDKTMLDALSPAATALADGSGQAALGDAAKAAAAGAKATKDMAATQGRARYVADGGRGHVDPGATSIAMILDRLVASYGNGRAD
jgi:dihydroxyacetone kinase-like protein